MFISPQDDKSRQGSAVCTVYRGRGWEKVMVTFGTGVVISCKLSESNNDVSRLDLWLAA